MNRLFAPHVRNKATGTRWIVSCVGDDDFGRLNIERLQRNGVDVSAVRIHDAYVTASAFLRYREGGDRDVLFNLKRSATGQMALDKPVRKFKGFARLLIEKAATLVIGVDANAGNARAGVFARAEASHSRNYAAFHWLFSDQTASRALIRGYAPPD
jgi:sugar/nucleoside kinase (ribokinase family)